MEKFIFFKEESRRHYTNTRAGETKFGERLSLISSFEELKNHAAQYIVFGIPEDVGIRANFGKPGAKTAWDSFLSSFLNIQVNQYNTPENCLILGHIDCSKIIAEAERLAKEAFKVEEKLGDLVQFIDGIVTQVVQKIVAVGKIPIIIGGGHNNAYGNIKGTSLALKKPINVLNIDAHTDLRRTDYRHSGNGFSYAKKEGYLEKYSMFGIHKNYTPQYIFDEVEKDEKINICLFEDLIKGGKSNQLEEFQKETQFLEQTYGLEIDCDAIENFSSSAMTPSGFEINQIRNFIKISGNQKIHYLHLCEANADENPQIGKALSYFVSDFIR